MTSPSQFGSSGSYVPPGYGVTPAGSAAPAKKKVLPENLRTAIVVVGSLALVMVIVQVVNWAMDYRLDQFGIGDRLGEPAVVGLASDLEHPARHRDGDPVLGQLADERVHHFPGRFACDR